MSTAVASLMGRGPSFLDVSVEGREEETESRHGRRHVLGLREEAASNGRELLYESQTTVIVEEKNFRTLDRIPGV